MTGLIARLLPLLLVVGSGAGCATRGATLGAGEDVSVCEAFAELLDFETPSPADPELTQRWADGARRVFERVDPDERLGSDRIETSDDLMDAVESLDADVAELLDALDGASSPDASVDVVVAFARGSYSDTMNAVVAELREVCR